MCYAQALRCARWSSGVSGASERLLQRGSRAASVQHQRRLEDAATAVKLTVGDVGCAGADVESGARVDEAPKPAGALLSAVLALKRVLILAMCPALRRHAASFSLPSPPPCLSDSQSDPTLPPAHEHVDSLTPCHLARTSGSPAAQTPSAYPASPRTAFPSHRHPLLS